MKQRTSPAPGLGQELDTNFRESYPSTKSSDLTNSRNNRKSLNRIALKRGSRGPYATPSKAMRVFLGVLAMIPDKDWATDSNINFSVNKCRKMSVLCTCISEYLPKEGLERKYHKTPVSRYLLGGA